MKYFKVVLPLFIGTLMYSALSISVGPRGLWPMSQLDRQKTIIQGNLGELYLINEDLNAKFSNLSADPDTISVYAHELGYIANGEKLIKLAGFSGGIDRNFDSGIALHIKKPNFLPEWICKFFGLFSGITAFFILTFIISGKKYDHTKK
jgi:hypothetical protein